MTRYSADVWVAKRCQQLRKGLPLTMRIRVDEHDESVAGCADSAVQRARLPMVFLADQSHPSIRCHDFLHFRGGIVTRTIIDHNNIQLPLIIRLQK